MTRRIVAAAFFLLIGRFMGYLPQVLVAVVVLFAALWLSGWAARLATA